MDSKKVKAKSFAEHESFVEKEYRRFQENIDKANFTYRIQSSLEERRKRRAPCKVSL